MKLNAREGFRRIARFYVYGWWIVAFGAAPTVFLYLYLSGPMPVDVDPSLWFWLRPCLLTVISLIALGSAWWIISGFLAPESQTTATK